MDINKVYLLYIAIFIGCIMAFIEIFPQYGLSIFPNRGEDWESPNQNGARFLRRFIAFFTWTALLVLVVIKSEGRYTTHMVMAVAFIFLTFILIRYRTGGILAVGVYIAAWFLFTISVCEEKRECMDYLLCWKILVLVGIFFIREGRFFHSKGVDYGGRALFSIGIIGFLYHSFK